MISAETAQVTLTSYGGRKMSESVVWGSKIGKWSTIPQKGRKARKAVTEALA